MAQSDSHGTTRFHGTTSFRSHVKQDPMVKPEVYMTHLSSLNYYFIQDISWKADLPIPFNFFSLRNLPKGLLLSYIYLYIYIFIAFPKAFITPIVGVNYHSHRNNYKVAQIKQNDCHYANQYILKNFK